MRCRWAVRCGLWVCVAGVLLAVARPAGAQELDRDGERLFRSYTRVFCQQFFTYEDKFILLPNYYRDREASTGKTYDQVEEELTQTRMERVGGNIVREVVIPPPRGEVIAGALVLPAIDVGHYGFIDSVEVVRVVRDNEMIVKDLRLIDPGAVGGAGGAANGLRKGLEDRQEDYEDMTLRLHGFSTQGLVPGQRYRGPREQGLQVAVAGADQHHNYVLVNYERMRRIRTSQFADALAYVDLSPAAFNELTRGNRVAHGAQGDKRTLIDLYRMYYTAFRVPRPEQVAAAPPVRTPPPTVTPDPDPAPGPGATPGDGPAVRPDPDPATPPADRPDRDNPPDLFPDVDPNDRPEHRPTPPPADDGWDEDPDDTDEDWEPPAAPDEPGFFGIPLN